MRFKGQSSIEYLVTYGWMVLAVAIVGGIAYDSVGSGCQRTFTGFFDDTVSVGTFGVDTQGNFKVSLENQEFRSITVEQFNVTSGGRTRVKTLDRQIEAGTSDDLKVPGYSQGGGCSDLKVRMVYDKGPLQDQVIRGSIQAPISIEAVELPDSPHSLDAQA